MSLCRAGCGFYGNAEKDGFCSYCYRVLSESPSRNVPQYHEPMEALYAAEQELNDIDQQYENTEDDIDSLQATSVTDTCGSDDGYMMPDDITSLVRQLSFSLSPAPSKSLSEEGEMRLRCQSGCGFFGSEELNGVCSKCLQSQQQGAAETEENKLPSSEQRPSRGVAKPFLPQPGTSAAASTTTEGGAAEESTANGKRKKNRCTSCRKNVGLLGFACRCGGNFCSEHRYSDKHNCQFDYKEHGRDQLQKDLTAGLPRKKFKL